MDRPTKTVVDCSTGIQEILELTDEEIAQLEADAEAYAIAQAERTAQAEALATQGK